MDRPSGPVSRLLPDTKTETGAASRSWEHAKPDLHGHYLTQSFMLHLSAVQVSPLLLLQQMLQTLELVNVERLQTDELLSGDQRNLLCCVHSCMSLRGQVTVTTCSD